MLFATSSGGGGLGVVNEALALQIVAASKPDFSRGLPITEATDRVSAILDVTPPQDGRNVYGELIKAYDFKLDQTTVFISLNYDIVLEHALQEMKPDGWYYPQIETAVRRRGDGVRILKPHGSLNWRHTGNCPPVKIDTNYELQPVSNKSGKDSNEFEQALIVAPTQLKQELNDPKSQSPEMTDLLGRIWSDCADVLASAKRLFLIGYSFPPTDHPVRTLLRLANSRRRGLLFDEIVLCTYKDGWGDGSPCHAAKQLFRQKKWKEWAHFDKGFEGLAKGNGRVCCCK